MSKVSKSRRKTLSHNEVESFLTELTSAATPSPAPTANAKEVAVSASRISTRSTRSNTIAPTKLDDLSIVGKRSSMITTNKENDLRQQNHRPISTRHSTANVTKTVSTFQKPVIAKIPSVSVPVEVATPKVEQPVELVTPKATTPTSTDPDYVAAIREYCKVSIPFLIYPSSFILILYLYLYHRLNSDQTLLILTQIILN
jgi:hypothetical protein